MTTAAEAIVPHRRRLWLYALAGLVMVFLILPSVIVVPMSFSDSVSLEFPPRAWSLKWYRTYFGAVEWQDATWVSVKTALLTVVLATPLGTAAAYGLHVSRLRLAGLIRVLLTLPLMVPVILLGIGIFYVYARLGLNYTITGLVLAHTMLALPFVAVTVAAGLMTYDMNQEMVARSLGAARLRAFLLITLPQIRFSVISAALFAFITSLDEVIVALFISGGENATLTRRMFNALRDEVDPTIGAISTCLIVVSTLVVAVAQLWGRRRAPGS